MPEAARVRTARCGCGQLTATALGEPVQVYACACSKCQQASGSAFTYSAVFPEPAVTTTGPHRTWRYRADSGRWIEAEFCPTCGVTVFSRAQAFPGLVGIAVGCFADPGFPPPQRVYWTSRQHRWLAFPDDFETHETQPN